MIERKRVMTHVNVDLDAIFSVCCYILTQTSDKAEQERMIGTIQFVSAGSPSDPLAVQIDMGQNKHRSGCFLVSNFQGMLPVEVEQEIDVWDTTAKSQSVLPLQMLLMGLKEDRFPDVDLIVYFLPMVRGLVRYEQNRKQAKIDFQKQRVLTINKHKFLILQNKDVSPALQEYANASEGVCGNIFWKDLDSNNIQIGISRYPYHETDFNLSHLQLDGWFTHPDGFLFSWGSRKSPKKSLPPQFQDLSQFLLFLVKAVIW
jgi:hypothetical protein